MKMQIVSKVYQIRETVWEWNKSGKRTTVSDKVKYTFADFRSAQDYIDEREKETYEAATKNPSETFYAAKMFESNGIVPIGYDYRANFPTTKIMAWQRLIRIEGGRCLQIQLSAI